MTGDGREVDLLVEWALLGRPGADLSSRTIGLETRAGPVRIAVDADGALHLLVPIAREGVAPRDTRSRGVVVLGQALEVDGETQLFTDLVCVDPALRPVFIRLATDICDRIASDPADPSTTVVAAVDEWRDLFRPQRERVTASAAEGLFGELVVLAELAARSPVLAFERWTGPDGAVHDFQAPALHLEVKTTAGRSGRITVHGLDQLDPSSGPPLRLAVQRLRPDAAGDSVPDLVARLPGLGVPRSLLRDKLLSVGYDMRAPDDWSEHRWTRERLDLWTVDTEFPGIRRSEQPEHRLRGIGTMVSYDLQLAGFGDPLGPPEIEASFDLLVAP